MSLKFGIVRAVDRAKGQVQVDFPDQEGLISHWLPVRQDSTLGNRSLVMPGIGEQVGLLMDEYQEDGLVLGGVYSSADAAPVTDAAWHQEFADGTVIAYDISTHTLTVNTGSGQISLVANGGVTLLGDLQVQGNIIATGTISGN